MFAYEFLLAAVCQLIGNISFHVFLVHPSIWKAANKNKAKCLINTAKHPTVHPTVHITVQHTIQKCAASALQVLFKCFWAMAYELPHCLDNNNSTHFIWVWSVCLAKRFMYELLPSDGWCLAYKSLIYFVLIIGYYYAQIHMGYETILKANIFWQFFNNWIAKVFFLFSIKTMFSRYEYLERHFSALLRVMKLIRICLREQTYENFC